MKIESKALIASVVVIALCLCTVGGVSYSWFSDTEQAEIEVTTGTVDLVGTLTSDDTTITGNNASVSGLVADRSIGFKYTVQNNSDIDTVYRAYIKVDNNSNTPIGEGISIYSTSLEGLSAGSTKTIYLVGSDTEGEQLDAGTAPIQSSYSFSITTTKDFNQQGLSISISVIAEAYQADYVFSDTSEQVNMSNGNATIPDNLSNKKVTVSGVPEESNAVQNVTIEFSSGFTENIVGKTVEVKEVEQEDSGFQIISKSSEKEFIGSTSYSVANESASDMGNTYVTMKIDGIYSDVEVYYFDGTDGLERMTVTSCESENGVTEVTFITTHFSTFTAVGNKAIAEVDGTYYSDVESFVSALSTGSSAKLLSDIEKGLSIKNANDININLNGFTVNENKISNTGILISGGTVGSITNGNVIGKYYGVYVDENTTLSNLNCTVKTYYGSAVEVKGTITAITGGTYHGYFLDDYNDPSYKNDTSYGGISSTAGLYVGSSGTVTLISNGEFQGTSVSLWNYGKISEITGGKFMNAFVDVNGKTFGDSGTYLNLFYQKAPLKITGGEWFNGVNKLPQSSIPSGYELIQGDSVTYTDTGCFVTGATFADSIQYYYKVVQKTQ